MPAHDDDRRGRVTVIDLETQTTAAHVLDAGHEPGEAVFAPGDDKPGGRGWLLSLVYNPGTDRSDVIILDIDNPDADPVAVIHLPTRVPHGFHGTWLADQYTSSSP